LILASDTMIVKEKLDDALSAISSNFLICFLALEEWEWKEKWFENKSIRWFPSLNSSLKKENEGKNLLHLLSTSISGDFKHKVVDGYIMMTLFLWPIRAENVIDDVIGQKRWFS